ncbi:MAG TPA: lipid II flippase MurJ [Bryobacteraceae bacterium]|nr:lipid II flippase MurJ [Bryobacteraceae bacterium]
MAGNIIGFARVALMAYLLGTGSLADSLAVAIGPIDTLNSVLINSMVFAFVPMLTAREGTQRTGLFLGLNRYFAGLFSLLAVALVLLAPWFVRMLAPGLEPAWFDTAVINFRVLSCSIPAAGMASIHSALLYTDRRFAPSAFNQATLNLFTVTGALATWQVLGVHGFALGYSVGAWVQLAVVWWCARSGLQTRGLPEVGIHWRELLAKPLSIALFAGGLAANITFTRAYATHAGPGVAAALDYCMRGVGVPLAFLVSPISNSLLPEIARLRSQSRLREAYLLIDRTIALAALAAVGVCAFALALREPAIRLLFERGSFTPESTTMVSAVFLGLGPAMIGWSLLELTSRSLFSLDRTWLPVTAAFIPLVFNVLLTLWVRDPQPHLIGLGASLGLLAGFAVLFGLARSSRRTQPQT